MHSAQGTSCNRYSCIIQTKPFNQVDAQPVGFLNPQPKPTVIGQLPLQCFHPVCKYVACSAQCTCQSTPMVDKLCCSSLTYALSCTSEHTSNSSNTACPTLSECGCKLVPQLLAATGQALTSWHQSCQLVLPFIQRSPPQRTKVLHAATCRSAQTPPPQARAMW